MRLHTLTWGEGDRVALLLHGMLGAATQYHQLGPVLATRGYQAIAVDLPGHGDSSPAPAADMHLFVNALMESVPARPALAIGHSMGAVVLSEALPALRPVRAVYVDVPFEDSTPVTPPTAAELRTRFAQSRANRTEAQLRATRPEWSREDCRVEAEAAVKFDIETAVALELAYTPRPVGRPAVPSLLIRAEPSRFVSAERAGELERMGFCVRSVVDAGHCVWYGHLGEFMAALDDWNRDG